MQRRCEGREEMKGEDDSELLLTGPAMALTSYSIERTWSSRLRGTWKFSSVIHRSVSNAAFLYSDCLAAAE